MSSRPEDSAANGVPETTDDVGTAGRADQAAWEVPHSPTAPTAPEHTPPGAFRLPGNEIAATPSLARSRPRVDVAAVVTLIVSLPWVAASFITIVLVLMILDVLLPIGALVTPIALIWLLSGIVVLLPHLEPSFAHRVLGLRRPTDVEAALIAPTWTNVAHSASLDPHSYQVWIDDRDVPTACEPGGKIVAVPHVIKEVPVRQRAAIMSHELGHHLAGHSRARLLLQWYSAPARWAFRMYQTVLRGTGRGGQIAGPAGAAIGCLLGVVWLVIGVAILVGMYGEPWLRAVVPLFLILPWLSRWAEKRCDRVAADLGFGPDLLDLFRYWQESGRDDGSPGGLLGRAFASRPTVGARMHALQDYLTEKGLG